MPIRSPRLKFRLHMSTLKSFHPHQATLVVLDAHDALRPVRPVRFVGVEDGRVDEIGCSDVDGCCWLGLETQGAAPGHVLNREQAPICDYNHIEVAVAYKETEIT